MFRLPQLATLAFADYALPLWLVVRQQKLQIDRRSRYDAICGRWTAYAWRVAHAAGVAVGVVLGISRRQLQRAQPELFLFH